MATLISKNLRYLLKKNNLNATALARATGVPQPTIHRMMAGESKDPRMSNLQPIADYFRLSVPALVYVDMQATDTIGKAVKETAINLAKAEQVTKAYLEYADQSKKLEERGIDNASPPSQGARPVPVISSVQAGALREVEDPYPVGAGYEVIYTDTEMSKWAFALDIKGDSMFPDFKEGDRVIIDPKITPQPGDFVVAKNDEHEATFKKYKPRSYDQGGRIIFDLVPINPDYPTIHSDIQQVHIIGVMVEHRTYRRKR